MLWPEQQLANAYPYVLTHLIGLLLASRAQVSVWALISSLWLVIRCHWEMTQGFSTSVLGVYHQCYSNQVSHSWCFSHSWYLRQPSFHHTHTVCTASLMPRSWRIQLSSQCVWCCSLWTACGRQWWLTESVARWSGWKLQKDGCQGCGSSSYSS